MNANLRNFVIWVIMVLSLLALWLAAGGRP
jgi:hypothetical protein